jgi:hypothetical protein
MALRNADAEPAVVGQRAVEVVGEFSVGVAGKPIVAVEARANLFDRGADRLLQLGEGEVDGGTLAL